MRKGRWPSSALQLFYQAIKLDPEFASAYGRAAWCFLRRKANHAFSITDLSAERAEAMRLARRAIELGKDDAVALYTAAHVLAYVVYDFGAASSAAERAVTLNPNLAYAWNSRGWVRVMVGDPDTAIEYFTRTMRLSPIDPFIHSAQYGMAWAHFMRGEYDQGCAWASKVLQEHSTFIHALGSFAANASLAGRLHEANDAVARLRESHPFLCTSHLIPTQGQSLSAAIRRNRVRIGLPEYPTEEERKRWALAELFPIQQTEYSGKVAEALRKPDRRSDHCRTAACSDISLARVSRNCRGC
jgi:tetratricopeptide (TPR) repeat protein